MDNIESSIKICDLIHFFGLNQVNLLLLERSKCHISLFEGLVFYLKFFGLLSKSTVEQIKLVKRLVEAIIGCLMVCFRSSQSIQQFVSSKSLNVLRLIQVIKD